MLIKMTSLYITFTQFLRSLVFNDLFFTVNSDFLAHLLFKITLELTVVEILFAHPLMLRFFSDEAKNYPQSLLRGVIASKIERENWPKITI